MIDAVSMRGFRCFRDRQIVPFQRLTLVYGTNNSGKSALVRLAPWLARSILAGEAGFDLDAPQLGGAGWSELRWRGSPHLALHPGPLAGDAGPDDEDLEVGLEADGHRWTWAASARDGARTPTLMRFGWSSLETTNAWVREPRATAGVLRGVGAKPKDLRFVGLLPKPAGAGSFERAITSLREVAANIRWVGPRRVGPGRDGGSRTKAGALDHDGSALVPWLAGRPSLRNAVSRWYERAAGCSVEVQGLGADLERLVARPLQGGFDVPFPDLGEGLQSAFAPVAHLAVLEAMGGSVVIEEPEAHLHPGLQRALVGEAIRVLNERADAQVVVETHSEVLLLEALLASVKHRLPVSLLWVEAVDGGASRVLSIPIDENGQPRTDHLKRGFAAMSELRYSIAREREAAARARGV